MEKIEYNIGAKYKNKSGPNISGKLYLPWWLARYDAMA